MARIAIVDDSRLARTVAVATLRKAGHAVTEIEPASLFDVLKALRNDPPDLLVTDYLMPGCPGLSLVRACHEEASLRGMKVLMVTAHHDDEIQERLLRVGVDRFLHKPFPPEILAAVADSLLAQED